MVRWTDRLAELGAQRCDGRGNPQRFAADSSLRQLVRGYSLKRKTSSARVTNVDAGHFGREIVVGKANDLRLYTAPRRCGLSGRPRRKIGVWFVHYFR